MPVSPCGVKQNSRPPMMVLGVVWAWANSWDGAWCFLEGQAVEGLSGSLGEWTLKAVDSWGETRGVAGEMVFAGRVDDQKPATQPWRMMFCRTCYHVFFFLHSLSFRLAKTYSSSVSLRSGVGLELNHGQILLTGLPSQGAGAGLLWGLPWASGIS